jgi:FTR1 family protein
MFEALVVTLREGIEGALVLAIALAFLERQGRTALRGALFAGTFVAIAASAALAAWLTRISYNQELTEVIAMLVGALLVVTLALWMWRAAPHLKQEVEGGIARAAGSARGAAAVFVFAFGMVLREGVETAIFLSAASFNSAGLALWLGASIGLLLAVVFGVLFVRGSLRVPLKPFFSFTTALLLLISLQLLVGGLHELSEAEVLPASRGEMAIIGPLIRNELLLFLLTVALAAVWLLRPTTRAVTTAGSGPEARLARAAAQRESNRRRWTGLVAVLVVGFLTTAFVQGSRMPQRPPAVTVTSTGGVLHIDPAGLDDGKLHFFETQVGATPVRFFAVKVNGRMLTCFDACEICGAKGYFEDGHNVICRNCASPIPRSTLGRPGGCNPIPLPHRTATNGALEIAVSDLQLVLPHLEGR